MSTKTDNLNNETNQITDCTTHTNHANCANCVMKYPILNETSDVEVEDNIKNIEISFSGCIWRCPFYAGVYKGLIDLYGYDRVQQLKIGGTSSGSLMALGIVMGCRWEYLCDLYKKIVKYSDHYGIYGVASIYVEIFLDKLIKNEDDYKKANGRLFIGITKFFNNKVIISSWKNNDELKNTIRESTYIPYYVSRKMNTITIDGRLSGGPVKISDNTIFISGNSDENCHIGTSMKFSMGEGLFTLKEPMLTKVFDDGYNATTNYFNKFDGTVDKLNITPVNNLII